MSADFKNRTDYTDDKLSIKRNTDKTDIAEFVYKRAVKPVEISGVTVWNFSNHQIDFEALEAVVDCLDCDKYLIPFSVEQVWAIMYWLLPEEIRDAEVLIYFQDGSGYRPRDNYYRDFTEEDRELVRRKISDMIHPDDEGDEDGRW